MRFLKELFTTDPLALEESTAGPRSHTCQRVSHSSPQASVPLHFSLGSFNSPLRNRLCAECIGGGGEEKKKVCQRIGSANENRTLYHWRRRRRRLPRRSPLFPPITPIMKAFPSIRFDLNPRCSDSLGPKSQKLFACARFTFTVRSQTAGVGSLTTLPLPCHV